MEKMAALASLPYPFATFIRYKAHTLPRKTMIQFSFRVTSSSLRRSKRKNYLRPKMPKTPNKPFDSPLEQEPIEEATISLNESDLRQEQIVRVSESQNLLGYEISALTITRIVGSFVCLLFLQTITVWGMDYVNSGKKDENLIVGDRKRDLRLVNREGGMGINGDVFQNNSAGVNVDDSEMEAKIIEIRKMAREVREAEKRKKVENGEADLNDASDDDDDDHEVVGSGNSMINNGIVKEVDGRLSKLRKRYQSPLLNVNMVNRSGEQGNEGKDEDLDGKEEDTMLLFKQKNKFRSHLATPKDKAKGFQSINGVREKDINTDDEKPVEKSGTDNNVDPKLNKFPETNIIGLHKEKKTPLSQNSTPFKESGKRSGNGPKMKLDKQINGSTSSGSKGTASKLNQAMNGGAKPERGHVQDSSNGNIVDEGVRVNKAELIATQGKLKMNDHIASTTSETHPIQGKKGQPNSNKLGSKQPLGIVDPWWSKLPYILVILMQKGIGNEAQRGFYNLRKSSHAENQSYSTYTVAFADLNDAKNFSYLLELAFEDQPDAAVEVAPLSTKDFKEVVESLDTKVFVLRKGELKLYAGQPLADAEAALKSLMEGKGFTL